MLNNHEMKMIKILLISLCCGFAVYLICSFLFGLEPRNSDAAGNGMQDAVSSAIALLAGIAAGVVVLVMLKYGASFKAITVVSLIPCVLLSARILPGYYERYSSLKYREKLNTPIVNPWETTDREALLAGLQAGKKIDRTNKLGQTLLHYAVYTNDFELLKFAVENGADVNKKDNIVGRNIGYTAAFYIFYLNTNGWKLLDYLAENGADLTFTIDLQPLIIYAAQHGCSEELSVLIKHGADVNTLDYVPLTPLYYVTTAEKAQILIDAGADVNFASTNQYQPTPVFYHLDDSKQEVLKRLIEAGADIEMRNIYGNTPLLQAVSYKREAATIILLNSGADIHVKNNENDNLLLLAARNCSDTKLLKMLVERGADKNAIGKEGKTAYDIALGRGMRDIEFLKP
jgi:ankyrin repeat protein